MLARMERDGHLRRVAKTISPRHITALCGKASSALLCEAVDDYDIPVVGGIYWTRARTASALGWPEGELGARFAACVARPIAPELVNDAPCQEVVITGDDVDLTMLPIPFMHEKDGGPYISAGVAFANDAQLGPNAGCYRLMFRTRQEMAIDLFTASDLRRYYSTAYAAKCAASGRDCDRRACFRAHGGRLQGACRVERNGHRGRPARRTGAPRAREDRGRRGAGAGGNRARRRTAADRLDQ